MARHEKYTVAQVIAAIQETQGMLTLAADLLGCDPSTLHRYVERYKMIQQAVAQQRERTTDIAEQRLFKAIENGEPWAIRFYLTCQARSRGYAEKIDLRIEILRAAERAGADMGMTAEEVLEEAEAYIREELHAR